MSQKAFYIFINFNMSKFKFKVFGNDISDIRNMLVQLSIIPREAYSEVYYNICHYMHKLTQLIWLIKQAFPLSILSAWHES